MEIYSNSLFLLVSINMLYLSYGLSLTLCHNHHVARSLSLIHSNIFTLSTLSKAVLNNAHILPLSSSIRSLLNGPDLHIVHAKPSFSEPCLSIRQHSLFSISLSSSFRSRHTTYPELFLDSFPLCFSRLF
jgi:hypothetical protein